MVSLFILRWCCRYLNEVEFDWAISLLGHCSNLRKTDALSTVTVTRHFGSLCFVQWCKSKCLWGQYGVLNLISCTSLPCGWETNRSMWCRGVLCKAPSWSKKRTETADETMTDCLRIREQVEQKCQFLNHSNCAKTMLWNVAFSDITLLPLKELLQHCCWQQIFKDVAGLNCLSLYSFHQKH